MTEPYASFRGERFFLSNFYPAPVTMYGKVYPSVEYAYVAAKTLDPKEREYIRNLSSPGVAKRYGRKLKVREDWEQIKLEVMETLVRRKFENPALGAMLLATGDEELVEVNYWYDTFWGTCNGKGENHLGKILMKVRDRLRNL